MANTTSSRGTGTSYGIHRYQELAYGCARKAYLDSIADDGGGMSKAMWTGSLMHAALAGYFAGQDYETIMKEFEPRPYAEPGEREKAIATCMHAMEVGLAQGRWAFGKVVEIEQEHEAKNFFPGIVARYTYRPDLVIRINETQARSIALRSSAIVPPDIEPGVWLVDHKTSGQAAGEEKIAAEMGSLQGAAYLHAWNLSHRVPAKGLLYNFIGLTKEPSFDLVPRRLLAIDEILLKNLATRLAMLPTRWLGKPDQEAQFEANPTSCFSAWGQCHHYRAGRCLRY